MVTATATGRTTIFIRWDRVDCILRNSDTTGYVVSYGRRGNESDSETVTVMGTTDRTYTLVGLMASTRYVVIVAAMNSDGVTGPFSNPVFVRTLGKTIGIYIVTVDLHVLTTHNVIMKLSKVFGNESNMLSILSLSQLID